MDVSIFIFQLVFWNVVNSGVTLFSLSLFLSIYNILRKNYITLF